MKILTILIYLVLFLGRSSTNCSEKVLYSVPSSVIDTALSYQNVLEVGNNGGSAVKKFLRSVNLPIGNPYCQAFVYYCMFQNGLRQHKTGLANGYYDAYRKCYGVSENNRIDSRYGIIVWKYPNSRSGHIGFLLKRFGNTQYVQTIEGNTSYDNSSPDGRLYRGKQGVFLKRRRLDVKLGKMILRGIIQ